MHGKKRNSSHKKPGSYSKTQFNNYAEHLKRFYDGLRFAKYMEKRKEIARQDIMITPDGPVELYRRDINGMERVAPPHRHNPAASRFYPHNRLGSTAGFIDSNQSVNHGYYPTAFRRHQQHYNQSMPFDWYDRSDSRSNIVYEKVEVLPDRHHNERGPRRHHRSHGSRHLRPDSPTLYNTFFNSEFLRSNSYYEDLKRAEYDRYNSKYYDVYEYYQYEDDLSDSDYYDDNRDRRRPNRWYCNAREVNYIDYDRNGGDTTSSSQNNSRNNSKIRNRNDVSNLSSSSSGKVLWRQTSRSESKTNANKKNKSFEAQPSETIATNNEAKTKKFNFQGSIFSPFSERNNYTPDPNLTDSQIKNTTTDRTQVLNQRPVVTRDTYTPDLNTQRFSTNFSAYPRTMHTGDASMSFDDLESVIIDAANRKKANSKSDPNFNDLPGNNAVRSNPLFDQQNFMY
jgi:hypothetical protein